MCLKGFAALSVLSICGIAAGQQTAPGSDPAQTPAQLSKQVAPQSDSQSDAEVDPRDNRVRPSTPEEEREKEIRKFDPLDSSDSDRDSKQETENRDKRKTRSSVDAPLPGSIAADNQTHAPNRTDSADENADATDQQYAGPAVLSRSYTAMRPLNPLAGENWAETLGISAIYDSGLGTSPTQSAGNGGNLYGNSVTWGLKGRHHWRRDQLGIVLDGQYQQYYPTPNIYNGTNNILAVDYTHFISHRLSLTVVGSASRLSQNYPLENTSVTTETPLADTNIASSPSIQIFDTTTKQFSLQTNLTWQKSARLSFNAGGTYFVISRDGPGLIGVGGTQAIGDVNYRLSHKATVGAYYSFTNYVYPHGFGTSYSNTVGMIYSYAFSRTLQLRVRAGGARVESLGLTTLSLNPVIASLLGRTSEIIDGYQKTYVSDISTQLVKDFKNGGTGTIAYVRGITPGNGLFQTSQQESVYASIGARISPRNLVNVSGGRDTLTSVSQVSGQFISEYGAISVSRFYRKNISLNFLVSYRYFNIADQTPIRNELRVSSGISWNPGAPRLWPF